MVLRLLRNIAIGPYDLVIATSAHSYTTIMIIIVVVLTVIMIIVLEQYHHSHTSNDKPIIPGSFFQHLATVRYCCTPVEWK